MDFLMLFVCYILTSVAIILAYLAEDSPILKTGTIGRCRSNVYRGLLWTSQQLPVPIWRRLMALYDKVFFQQNAVFQVLYVVMVIAGHVVLVVDCLPYLYSVTPDVNHVIAPSVCLVVNTIFFTICCYSDAGVITKDNVTRYHSAYSADGVLYKQDASCCTCRLSKPARSKHCAISDRCYFRFDHYCAWTNNVVGGLNHRWFLVFLMSLIVMCANAVVMSVNALINVTAIYQLMTLRYVDTAGLAQPMTFRVLMQTLFMQLPRLVFLMAALTVIAVFMSGFTLYHLYLVCTNQTTNERYKRYHLRKAHNTHLLYHPYSRGLLSNLLEELLPLQCCPGVGDSGTSTSNGWTRTNGSLKVGEKKKRR